MRYLLSILVCIVFISGCGQTLKHSWNNFRAYYNTYYNAEKSFKTGLKEVEKQPFTIDPTKPVRIHRPPIQAANSEFQQAIDKAATILRKFPQSKWADDAILLIGKSYYYRQEFYPALQKFEELSEATSSAKLRQVAIIWKGRTQLDLGTNAEAINYLQSSLTDDNIHWRQHFKAEVQALIAEHFAMQENWKQASELLSDAVSNIEEKPLLGRTLFLYGQMLERLGRFGEAYFAFANVSRNFPGFEYNYWAGLKQADVARKEGNLELAISIYQDLRKDDKNVDRINELVFEIARTREMQGEVEQALNRYNKLLYGKKFVDRSNQQAGLKADIYYRIGKIYSEKYENYRLAAAYFDSASTFNATPQKADSSMDAQTLAQAFGSYANLQQKVNRADSLLRLGDLSPDSLDATLKRIRERKRKEVITRRQRGRTNTFVNQKNVNEESLAAVETSKYGFLNYKSSGFVSQAKVEFRVLWGERPLIDNWRRMEIVRQSNVSPDGLPETKGDTPREQDPTAAAVKLDVDEIPRTQKEKDLLKTEKVNAQYELGNLFFLSLNVPDSARHYFYQVVNTGLDQQLRSKAMYSLYQLHRAASKRDSVLFWKDRILEEYPNSTVAQRLQSNLKENDSKTDADRTANLKKEYHRILASDERQKPLRLRKLALANRSSDLASHIHYQAIEAYIRQARAKTDSARSVSISAAADTLNSPDSTKVPVTEGRSLNHSYWDSVRIVLQEFDTTFVNAQQKPRVRKLREAIQTMTAKSASPSCEELGVSISVDPNMQSFLSTVEYPKKLEGKSISGEIIYDFTVTPEGNVISYKLVSNRTSLGIEEALEKAFQQSLRFRPFEKAGLPSQISCTLSFPIQL